MVRAFAEITVEHSFGGGDGGGGGGAEGCVHAKQPSHSDQPHFLSQPFVLVAQEALHLPGSGAGGGGVAVHSEQPSHADQPHFLSQPFVLVAQEALHSPGAGAGGGGAAVHSEQPLQADQPHFLSQPFVLVAQEGLQFANEAQAPHLAHFDQAHLTVQSWPSSRQNLRQSSPAAEASAMASTQYLISGERQVRAECRTITCVVWYN